MRTIIPAPERFWAKVDRSGGPDACWPWTASRTDGGYGVFHPTKSEIVGAHRYALELHLGRPLAGWALHGCDNPPCCNTRPGHVYEGDHIKNVADAVERGRNKRGARDPGAKLTDATVVVMRERAAKGEPVAALAVAFGVSPGQVSNIIRGQRWRHVGGPITQRYDKTRSN